MNGFVNYLIEANIGLMIFLACYWLFLRQETNFRLIRIFMLTGILVSLAFPLFHFENYSNTSAFSLGEAIPPGWAPASVSEGAGDSGISDKSFPLWTFISLIYGIGFVIFFLTVAFQLTALLRMIARSRTYRLQNLHVAESNEDKPTFSFFNFIFIGNAHMFSVDEKQKIILHESVHARQWHSFDILLISGLRILFWFNPLVTTYKKAFVHLHEFEADARIVEHSDPNKYCSLLARVALRSANFTLVNHFNSSLTVKRITMIRRTKNKMTYWKMAACGMLVPVTFLLLSCQDQLAKSDLSANQSYYEVDDPAVPEGGLEHFYDMIRRNIRYPAESRAEHNYGNVLVQFVVTESGTLSDVEVLQSPDAALGNEAIRILALGGKWTPAYRAGKAVKQQMVLPIKFKLDYPGMEKDAKREVAVPKQHEAALPEIVVVGYAKRNMSKAQ